MYPGGQRGHPGEGGRRAGLTCLYRGADSGGPRGPEGQAWAWCAAQPEASLSCLLRCLCWGQGVESGRLLVSECGEMRWGRYFPSPGMAEASRAISACPCVLLLAGGAPTGAGRRVVVVVVKSRKN